MAAAEDSVEVAALAARMKRNDDGDRELRKASSLLQSIMEQLPASDDLLLDVHARNAMALLRDRSPEVYIAYRAVIRAKLGRHFVDILDAYVGPPDLSRLRRGGANAANLLDDAFWLRDSQVTKTLPYVVKGVIGKGQLLVLWGQAGLGKSFVTVEMLCAVGAGEVWRGRRTRRGICIYVAAESSRLYIENRIAALRQERPAIADADVLIAPVSLDLLHAEHGDVDRIIETARLLSRDEGEVAMIALDTLSATFGGGDENTPGDMGQYVRNVRRIITDTGAAVAVVHHAGKSEAAGMRGHSALIGALDAELVIEGERDGERILRTGKVRDGAAYADLFAFRLRTVDLGADQDGDPIITCVVDSTDDTGTQRARHKRKRAHLGKWQKAALQVVEDAGGRITRLDALAKLKEQKMPRQRIHDAIASLIDSNFLISDSSTPVPELRLP
jgi:hypothetical protein